METKFIIKQLKTKNMATLTNTKTAFDLSNFATIKEALNNWSVRNLIPKTHNVSQYKTLDELSAYLTKRKAIADAKEQAKKESKINAIKKAGKLIEATITIEWKKNRTWGSNPTAAVQIISQDLEGNKIYQNYTSGSISGCGYDKESTAIAGALNQSNEILKLFFDKINPDVQDREMFGYGVRIYDGIATISGGVGVSCYYGSFKSVGYEFERIAAGKTFDVYKISIL